MKSWGGTKVLRSDNRRRLSSAKTQRPSCSASQKAVLVVKPVQDGDGGREQLSDQHSGNSSASEGGAEHISAAGVGELSLDVRSVATTWFFLTRPALRTDIQDRTHIQTRF
jgi:hypothetical protein